MFCTVLLHSEFLKKTPAVQIYSGLCQNLVCVLKTAPHLSAALAVFWVLKTPRAAHVACSLSPGPAAAFLGLQCLGQEKARDALTLSVGVCKHAEVIWTTQ